MRRALALTLLLIAGVAAVVAGLYLWLGLAAALIAGGVFGIVSALLTDDGRKTAAGNG